MGVGAYPTCIDLSRVSREQGKYKESLEWGQKAHKGLEKNGDKGGYLDVCKFSMGKTLELLGKYGEAKDIMNGLYSESFTDPGKRDGFPFECLAVIASIASNQGDYKTSKTNYRDDIVGLEKQYGRVISRHCRRYKDYPTCYCSFRGTRKPWNIGGLPVRL